MKVTYSGIMKVILKSKCLFISLVIDFLKTERCILLKTEFYVAHYLM